MNKVIKLLSYLGLILGAINSVQAAEAKPSTLLYISPNDYKYSVHLLTPYYDYWYNQGPLVEPIAFQALQAKDSDLTVCKANETADRIVRITPYMFYNPQLRMYHSKLEATVYSGSGNVLGTYVGKGQQLGFVSFDNGTRYNINKAYKLAMQDLMSKIDINPASAAGQVESKLPCGIVGAQDQPRISFY